MFLKDWEPPGESNSGLNSKVGTEGFFEPPGGYEAIPH